jgi:hypothetical protein
MLRSAVFVLLLCSIAGAQDVSVRVVDEEGKPVEGATVQALWWSDIDLGGPRATLVTSSARTDAKGTASARTEGQHVCLLAFEGGRAVFACHTPVQHVQRPGFVLQLGAARAVHGQIVDAKGAPVDKARVRLLFAGGYEWHGIDASVGKDGAFTFAPLPDDVLVRGVRLQALAPGMAAFEVELKSDDVDAAVPVRMVGTRRVTGRIVDA